ncbi:MAG: hypothetical protein G01um101429_627 [Parcubacteria group bacterium Gr01-1014_29]|nr:MAG: hypothetical protein G01um101429_627 [Parcubacteria group bacterium Gr01-1014_29]
MVSTALGVYMARKGPIMVSKEGGKELCEMLPLLSTPLDESGMGSSPYIARDICHFVFAIEKNDPTICENLKTGEFKAQCYATSASKQNDPSICDNAPIDVRDKCYSSLAQQTGGSAVCEKIQRLDDRDNCFSNQASRMGDAELCTKIGNINIRDGCYMSQANRDPAYCGKVTDVRMREDCKQNVMRR